VRSTEVYEGGARAFSDDADLALTSNPAARRSLMRHVRKTLDPVRIHKQIHHYFRPTLLRATDAWWRTKGARRWASALPPPDGLA
jgi:hypothetical protein